MLSKIPNLRYFEIVDWRGMNRPAFIAIFHYIDNFGFFQGDSVKLFRILTELRDLETDVSLVGSRLLSLHEFWRKWNHYQFRI